MAKKLPAAEFLSEFCKKSLAALWTVNPSFCKELEGSNPSPPTKRRSKEVSLLLLDFYKNFCYNIHREK